MEKLRIGIIGVGNMGSAHARNLFDGKVQKLQVTALCDHNPKRLEWASKEFGEQMRYFDSVESFYGNSHLFDIVVVAVPHYDHAKLVMEGFKHNVHVITEKPAGVYTKQVREMNEAAKGTNKLFGIMYNQRTNPVYQRLRSMVKNGELGTLKRMNWIITDWYRPQSYHDSSEWRSTWGGEGGGVLLNQDPHQLDLWQWILGMPKTIRAFASYGKYYNIEVEDDVTVYSEYENGMTATFITSTGETPGTNRMEIAGTLGKAVVENGELIFYQNAVDERVFNDTFKGSFGNPQCTIKRYPERTNELQHMEIFSNFADAITKGTPLLAPGIEGINGLTISNCIHLSDWTNKAVDVAYLDENLFYHLLTEKIKTSTIKKPAKEQEYFDVRGKY